MVLLYALPLMLFAGMVTIKRSTLTSDLGLAAAITAGLLGTYLVTFLIVRFALRRTALACRRLPRLLSALPPSRLRALWCSITCTGRP